MSEPGRVRSLSVAAILRDEADRPGHSDETRRVLLDLADGFAEGYNPATTPARTTS